MNSKKKTLKTKHTSKFKYLAATLFVGILLYAFVNSIIADILIKKSGQCVKAYIYKETSGGRTSPDFGYRFYVDSKTYNGLMSRNEVNKVGDNICIVYYIGFPDFNRSINYFDKGQLSCDCR